MLSMSKDQNRGYQEMGLEVVRMKPSQDDYEYRAAGRE